MNPIRYIIVNGYKNADNMKVYTNETLPDTYKSDFCIIADGDKGYLYNSHSKLLRIITTNKITLSQLLAWQKIEPIELPPAAIESFGTLFGGGHPLTKERLKKQISYLWTIKPSMQYDDVVLDLDNTTWEYIGSHIGDIANKLIYW